MINTTDGQTVDHELMKKCIMKVMIRKAAATSFERTKHDNLSRVLEKITTYKFLIHTEVVDRVTARAAKVILDELEVGQLDTTTAYRVKEPHLSDNFSLTRLTRQSR